MISINNIERERERGGGEKLISSNALINKECISTYSRQILLFKTKTKRLTTNY